jgi:hypothetical protein
MPQRYFRAHDAIADTASLQVTRPEAASTFTLLRDAPWLFAIWAFATFWNWNKAFHIDDTAHLEIAHWIALHPLHPMSGMLNWSGVLEPIHRTNQPHLYFYLMAGWASVLGWSEQAMHALQAVFSLGAILAFQRLANRLVPGHALLLTALLALGPGFVLNQNSMVEIPQAALWIGFYAVVLGRRGPPTAGRVLLAGALVAAALLTKYTAVLLLPALLLDTALRGQLPLWRRIRLLVLACLPLVVLAAWSLFNWFDYGGVHIAQRDMAPQGGDRRQLVVMLAVTWLICLGVIAPFAAIFGAAALRTISRSAAPLAFIALTALALLVTGFLAGSIDERHAALGLKAVALATGGMMAAVAVVASIAAVLRAPDPDARLDALLLGWWGWSAAAFVILLAPFMATRHVLVSLPPFLLLGTMLLRPWFTRAIAITGVAATVVLTAALAKGDDWYADAYRTVASEIRQSLPADATVWFTGHWGWQWYAEQQGMRPVVLADPQLRPGDFLVERSNEDRPTLPPGVTLREQMRRPIERPCCTPYLVTHAAGFYESSPWHLPWALSRMPVEEITVFEVVAE